MKQYLRALHHVGLPTSNMKGTIDFYAKLGGEVVFDKMDEYEGKPIRVVHIVLAGLKIEVYERDAVAGKKGAVDHIAFEVDDIEAAFQRAKELNLTFFEEKIAFSSYWPGNARWFIVIGCNGEWVEFCQG